MTGVVTNRIGFLLQDGFGTLSVVSHNSTLSVKRLEICNDRWDIRVF